jgi:hypothetical protein
MEIADLDIDVRIKQYIQLRDKIKEVEAKHKEELKPYKQALETLSGVLLTHLQNIGGEGVRTQSGTVYVSEKKSASLADPAAFMDYVVSTERWDLLDRKANVTAVTDYISEFNAPPPGVNYSTMLTVGVRRK